MLIVNGDSNFPLMELSALYDRCLFKIMLLQTVKLASILCKHCYAIIWMAV